MCTGMLDVSSDVCAVSQDFFSAHRSSKVPVPEISSSLSFESPRSPQHAMKWKSGEGLGRTSQPEICGGGDVLTRACRVA